MNPTDPKGSASPKAQNVLSPLQFKSGNQSIQIEFTDQQLGPQAGTVTFWSFLHGRGWIPLLTQCLPHPQRLSNTSLSAVTKALSVRHGWLCGARKLTPVAYLRRDPLIPELVGLKRIASQSV